jgi:hypothetical protein
MIYPFYVLDQLTIIRSVEYSLHVVSEQSRSTFPNSIFVLEFPGIISRNKLQPTTVLPNLANTTNSTDSTLVLGVIFTSVKGADFEC